MKEYAFQIEGIMCPKCVKKITDELLKNDGINKVSVSDNYQFVSVIFNELEISLDNIKDSIERIEGKLFKIIN